MKNLGLCWSVSVGLPWILEPCWRKTIFSQPLLTWSLGFCEVGQECTMVMWAQEKMRVFLRPSQPPLSFPHPEVKGRPPPSQFTWKDDHNDKGVLEVIFLLFHDPHFGIGIELAGTPGFQKWSGKRLVQASEEPMTYLLRTLMSCIQEQLSNTVHWPVSEQGGPTCPPPKAMVIGFSHPPHDFLHHCSKPDQAKL